MKRVVEQKVLKKPNSLRRKSQRLSLRKKHQLRKSQLQKNLHQQLLAIPLLATLLMWRCQSSVSLSLKAPSPSG